MPIMKTGFLPPLVKHLGNEASEEVQCHAISTLRNLAATNEKNKRKIMEAGVVERIISLVAKSPVSVMSEMTACLAVLALSG